MPPKKQPAEAPKFSMEREERILEVQEVFESIYQQSQKLLQSTIKGATYIATLQETIKFAKTWIHKLKDPKDEFIKENAKIVSGFRTALRETIGLLEILEKIEGQREDLKHVNLHGIKQNANMALNNEIRNSERRLQRLRAGVKLTKVLQDQLERKMEHIQHLRQQAMEAIPHEEVQDKTALNILQQLDPVVQGQGQRVPMVDVMGPFMAQKLKVQEMLKQYIKREGSYNFDFSEKQDNLLNYFQQRFKLANIYMGDEQINEFLRLNKHNILQLMKEQKQKDHHSTEHEKQYLKDLDPKNFVPNEDVEQNSNTLKKILRVNQEIKRELMLEDHQDNINAINNFKIQQKQNYWERMFDDDISKPHRSQIRSQEILSRRYKPQTRPQTNQLMMVTHSQASFKKPTVSTLKKKPIFFQAHPNFPLIRQVYNDTEKNILVQEERLKEFIIESEPIVKRNSPMASNSTYDFSRLQLKSAEGWTNQTKMVSEDVASQQKTLQKLWGDTWINY